MNKHLKHCVAFAATLFFGISVNAQVVINEYCSSTTIHQDEDKANSDWIELYNTTDSEVSLKGWHLSDKSDNVAKWTFPDVSLQPKAFMLIYASGKDRAVAGKPLHTNFNISTDGETVYLSDANGNIIHKTDSISVPNNASRGLFPDGSSNWVFFASPTPDSANTTKTYATTKTSTVEIEPCGGVFTTPVTVTLKTSGNTPIYYTLDCTVPTAADSLLYTGPITIDSTTVVRAITFDDNLMPAQPTTQSYIFGSKLRWVNRDKQGKPITTETRWVSDNNGGGGGGWGWGGWGGHNETVTVDPVKYIEHGESFALPVVSLTMEPDDLWDYNTGMYVEGPNANLNATPRRANYYNDWEKPVHIELYWTDGRQVLCQDAGVQISGAYSRMNDQKSMAMHARKAYGAKYFDAKLFDELDLTRFKSFTLRDSGNDFGNTHFRDAMITHLVDGNNIDIQAYQPAVVFLNGEYWGILNMREKLNEDYIENHYPHVSADNVDIMAASDVTKSITASEGDDVDYNAMISYVKSNDMTNDACYQHVSTLIDIDEYIEYMVSEIYGSNNDWPHNNIKIWKSKKRGGRWRWFLYDTDQSYSIWGDQSGDDKLGTCLEEKDTHGNTWANVLFRNLTKSEKFRNALANRFADRMNNEFLAKNVNHLIDSLYGNIADEIGYHNSRWGKSLNNGQGMKDFAKNRPKNMRSHLRKHFDVGEDVKVTLYANDAKAGYVQLNSLTLKSFPWSGTYFKNVPISIRAIARPGYRFVRWEDDNKGENTHAGISVKLNGAMSYTAIFEKDDANYNSVVINEINFKSSADYDTKDWIELYNTTAAAIDISNWVISDDKQEDAYKIPGGTIIPPYGYIVVCENLSKMLKYNPNLVNAVGDFQFGLSKADLVRLKDSEGNLIDEVEYDSGKNWPDANGNGYTMALVDPFADNERVLAWGEDEMYGTPGSENGIFTPSHDDFSISDNSFNIITDVNEKPEVEVYAACYPNPFVGDAAIVWEQTADADVVVELYAASGRKLATVADGMYSIGEHVVNIGSIAGNWSKGLYFAKITIVGQKPVIIKMIKQ
ncbi:MAG: CotH kinase family protein [Salinivirgaceae bacterium]|nr:CotH kinase family protein [Salinivirgaceae bacterium]